MAACCALLLAAVLAAGPAPAGEPPRRVVSINLCTDQLAMLLAAPGQLVSVSALARDPRISAMADRARGFPVNAGLAEEVYLLRPDLVLAGSYGNRAAQDMLRRLGVPVVTFAPAQRLEDVPAALEKMGAALGRREAARREAEAFRRRLAALPPPGAQPPLAALYDANGYTSGDATLAGQMLRAAGFANVAQAAGYGGGGVMPLELLALSQPAAVISPPRYPGGSRSEEILDHPVLRTLRARGRAARTGAAWACGTPHVLDAVEDLVRLRLDIEARR